MNMNQNTKTADTQRIGPASEESKSLETLYVQFGVIERPNCVVSRTDINPEGA
jgi:hypothetical protein